METAFLAFSFRNEDRGLADAVGRLLASHNIRVVTGETLGGADITPAVRTRIEKADGLIGLLTRRERLTEGGWRTHDWVRDELNIARQLARLWQIAP